MLPKYCILRQLQQENAAIGLARPKGPYAGLCQCDE